MNDGFSAEIRAFGNRLLSALLRVVALIIFAGFHYLANAALMAVIPSNLERLRVWAEDAVAVAFLVIYVYLAWEMLTVFVPGLRRTMPARVESVELTASQEVGE